jgi:NAD+ synthase (glutamine-hydrolysing)
MNIAVAQLNPIVGDLDGNLEKMKSFLVDMKNDKIDLFVTPELYLCGYPPRDLLVYPWFMDRVEETVEKTLEFSKSIPDTGILVGLPRRNNKENGKNLYNSAYLIKNGKVLFIQDKMLLPTYDVFDEARYFDPGEESQVYNYHGTKLGISICEDAWNDPDFEKTHEYNINPIEILAKKEAQVFLNLSASPFHAGKSVDRFRRFAFHAKKWNTPFFFVGQVGANDELVFDGQSLVVDGNGKLIGASGSFEENVKVYDIHRKGNGTELHEKSEIETIHDALVCGVSDYMRKCGFKSAVLGLSGGIDSAVTACIAVDALGAENVQAITMPSPYSSEGSVNDSLELAKKLGIRCDQIKITAPFKSFKSSLTKELGAIPSITEENLQARIRGVLLMAYSNTHGSILLTTGNKSELAVGYCTLYGDMNGGLAVISDLPKMKVYELAKWYNSNEEIIPSDIITKPPSAELRPDQYDQETLPDYEVLDTILEAYLEKGKSQDNIIADGFEPEVVKWVIRAVNLNEYKRKQAAPGLRVTTKAFGVGRRMPIASRY